MDELSLFEPKPEQFGVFWNYIISPDVTDIDYNGRELWITDLKKGHYRAEETVTEQFLQSFTHNISNCANRQFNYANKVLEADTKELRISILHDSVAVSGTSICIRKSPAVVRSTIKGMIADGYCTGDIRASVKLRAGKNEFCFWRGAGKRQDRVCKVFYAVYSQGGACDYN